MKNFPLLFCLGLIFVSSVFSQDNQNPKCPTVDVSGGGRPEKGQPLNFTANVIDSENRQIKYIWTVSSGKITSGQGTPSITVEPDLEESVTVTVEVEGFPEGCANTSSETSLHCPTIKPMLFDEYGSLTNDDFKTRIQNLYVELGNNPGAQGYFISYGTDREIARREKQIRDAVTFLNLDAPRLTLVNGGANPRGKGVWTKVWIVPPGADDPTPDM